MRRKFIILTEEQAAEATEKAQTADNDEFFGYISGSIGITKPEDLEVFKKGFWACVDVTDAALNNFRKVKENE